MLEYTFSLWYLLVPYALVLLGSSLFVFFNLYHVAKFGLQSVQTTLLLSAYFISYLIILGVSAMLIASYQWNVEVPFLEVFPFATGSSTTFGL